MSAARQPNQRHSAAAPCPICGGHDGARRGQGERCHGFISGEWCHCSRENHAGQAKYHEGSKTYGHRLEGSCPCGVEHRAATASFKHLNEPPPVIDRLYTYRDREGTPRYQGVRFRNPKGFKQRPVDPQGNPGRLWSMKGVPLVPYRLPEMLAADPSAHIHIVEGEKDADRLASLGLIATTNIGGAEKWRPEYNTHFAGRVVVIIGDNDDPGRRHVRQVAKALDGVAASVKVLELDGLPEKGDVSDWLDAGGTVEALAGLVEQTPVWSAAGAAGAAGRARAFPARESSAGTPPTLRVVGGDEPPDDPGTDQKGGGRTSPIVPNEAFDDPSRLARMFQKELCQHPDGSTLVYSNCEYLEWAGSYRAVPVEVMRARLHRYIKATFDKKNIAELAAGKGGAADPPKVCKVTGGLVTNAALALTGYTLLESRTPQPSWLTESPPFPAQDVLPTRNALVYLPWLIEGRDDAIRPPSPLFFAPYCLTYDFDPKASLPSRWLEFLASLWPDDQQSIDTLQEWFGYNLTADTCQQKILMLIGPKRSGKGTIARMLRELIGAENVANPNLAGLATNFGLAPLVGKPTAIITDARLSGRADIAQIVERLLSVSGEDAQTIDRKHQSAVTVKLPTRFTLISNELLRLTDTSGALAGRLILLPLKVSFYGKEDPGLTAALMPELGGILLWAIEGWRRLRDRGRFVQPEAGVAMVDEMQDLGSPVGAFLKDCCRVEAGAETMAATLYRGWKSWCADRGRDNPGDEFTFGRNLRAVLPNLKVPSRRQPDGTRKRFYEGIGLIETAPNFD